MKLAIVHDWLTSLGGAERILIEMHHLFPEAPIYTLFYDKEFLKKYLPHADVRSSFLQRMPGIRSRTKLFWPLLATGVELFDLSSYDAVLSSSVTFSKGIIIKPRTLHVCYCYSPSRSLWDNHSLYVKEGVVPALSRHTLRIWDHVASDRVDKFIAISHTVRKRIAKYYNRDSSIVYPPITPLPTHDLPELDLGEFYLLVSRLYRHKNVDIAIDAFRKLGYKLLVIGDGPLRKNLERLAPHNIGFFGEQSDTILAAAYRDCKALIMPQEEDFGLTPLEAMGFGKPVLALRHGGATETVVEGVTGEFFDDPIPESLADGVQRMNRNYGNFDPSIIRKHVQKFSLEQFEKGIKQALGIVT